MYQERSYRTRHNKMNSASYPVIVDETDLWISSEGDFKQDAVGWAKKLRAQVLAAEERWPGFISSLAPMDIQCEIPLIQAMVDASAAAGVGPMAAVAGAISQSIGCNITAASGNRNVCVENGGDIYIDSTVERVIMIHAGRSALSEKIGLRITAEQFPLGICTSAGTVGHSLSFGHADAVVVLSKDTALADAVATATGNILKTKDDISKAIAFVSSIPGVLGAVLIIEEQLGAWGNIELVPVEE